MTDRRTRHAQDLILAAAVHPKGWEDVLHHLAEVTGCVAGGITIEDARTRRGEPLVYFGFDPDHVRRTFDHYLPMNPLFGIADRMKPGFVVTNGDVVDESVFRRTEFFNGWARPQALCCPTTVVLSRRSERYCPLTLVRPDGKGDVPRSDLRWLRGLVPHLVRAMDITVELDTRSLDHSLIDVAMEGSNLGLIALDEEAYIVYANSVAETRLHRELGIRQRQGRLSGVTPHIDGQLKQAVSLAYANKTFGEDIRIEAEGRPPLVVKIIPLASEHGFARIVPRRPATLVIFRDAPLDLDRRLRYIGEVYRLTPAERRVLAAVLDGTDMKSIASTLCVSMATLKTHLTRIFSKTGTSRQKALIGLVLKDIDLPRRSHEA
jgi:DNA-binding NarL/FixJ family response regulator